MAKCECGEVGTNGTKEHDELCGKTYRTSIGQHGSILDVTPCFNHEENYIKGGFTVVTEPKPRARIDNWKLLQSPDGLRLVGTISGHPRQSEFKRDVQITSRVERIDFERMEAETLNTIYLLGEPATDMRLPDGLL